MQDETIVTRIVKRHFGEYPRGMKALAGGLNNQVFRIDIKGQPHVVRLHSDPEKLADYQKEDWAMDQAREAGVPTARVLEVGLEGGHPFMILEEARGMPAIGSASPGRHLWPRWAEFLDNELRMDHRLQLLDRLNVLPDPAQRELYSTLRDMRDWKRRPVLQHGDLRLKNVIVSPDDGHIVALLDWDNCLSAPPPYWDLAIALHDLGLDEKEAFLEGYGLSPRRFENLAPVLRALDLLNYAWAIEQAIEAGQRERVAWLKARLRDAFDVAL